MMASNITFIQPDLSEGNGTQVPGAIVCALNWSRFLLIIVLSSIAGSSQAQALAAPRATTAAKRTANLPRDPAHARLVSHGLSINKQPLIDFLEHGFPKSAKAGKLPDEPSEKTQLAVDAMARLAELRATEAVPMLIQIAAGNMPPGVAWLLQHDVNSTDRKTQTDFRSKALRLLQFNAVNALGVIGDKHALPIVQSVYAAERDNAARIQYTINLACLGDTSHLDFLVQLMAQGSRHQSAAAAEAFKIITGEDLGFTKSTPIRGRREKAAQAKDWYKANARTFVADPAAVLQRRMRPDVPLPMQPRSARDLVKLSTYYFDFDNKFHSRDAREKLQQGGRGFNEELKRIATDPNEDLDVRMEAMNWFFTANGEEARPLLKKLRKDENPEVGDKANTLIESLDRGDVPQRPAVTVN